MNERTLKRWLLASLAVNLFLAGGVAGGAWRLWKAERTDFAPTVSAPAAANGATNPAVPPRGLRYAADALSADQRLAYRLGLRDARREASPQAQTARDGRQEVLRLIAAPQLDRAAVAAALARTREADSALRARIETSVVEFASTLSAEDRRKLTEGLARRTPLNPTSPAGPLPNKQ